MTSKKQTRKLGESSSLILSVFEPQKELCINDVIVGLAKKYSIYCLDTKLIRSKLQALCERGNLKKIKMNTYKLR